MAVWQFHLSLVPRAGIQRALGRIPDSLEEYQPVNPLTFHADREYPDYWAGIDRGGHAEQLRQILPDMKSWSAQARMFGSEQGDRIQFWEDDVACDIDVRHFSLEYVRQICALAEKWQCVLVLNEGGEVISADIDTLLEKISRSRAYASCRE